MTVGNNFELFKMQIIFICIMVYAIIFEQRYRMRKIISTIFLPFLRLKGKSWVTESLKGMIKKIYYMLGSR